jgi:ribosome-binding factor A
MTTEKRRDVRDLCARTHDDDGIDPRTLKKERIDKGPSRKDMQLCKQVSRCLSGALENETADPVLSRLIVMAVEPDPHAGRLRVTVAPREMGADGSDILRRLRTAKGFLRACLGGAVHRKRIPELVFALGPAPASLQEMDHE